MVTKAKTDTLPQIVFNVKDLESGKVVISSKRSETGRWGTIRGLVMKHLTKKDEAMPMAALVQMVKKEACFKDEEYRLVYTMTRNALKKFKGYQLARYGSSAFIVKVD